MTGFVNPAAPIVWIIIAAGIIYVSDLISTKLLSKIDTGTRHEWRKALYAIGLIGISYLTLQPNRIIIPRRQWLPTFTEPAHNTRVYRSLDTLQMPTNAVVLNCPVFEDVELMFWQDVTAYHWWPDKRGFDSLQTLGRPVYAFSKVEDQHLPDYIRDNPEVTLINAQLFSNPL